MEILGILLVVGIVALIVAAKTITSLIYISGPNEVLVFSGGTRVSGNRRLGYKLIKGGRGIRIPLLETVDRLDLTNLVIDVSVNGAYSKGGIPLNVQAVANVKVAGDEPVIHNALERILDKSRDEVIALAKETLEGNLRGVLATLTPEQVNEDKMAFAQSLLAEAEHDLTALGLVLDTLKIQSVTDDQGYLQAIGRQQSAEILKRARIAEANARATAAVTAASNREQTLMAQIGAREEIVRAEANRRIMDARTRRAALAAEEQGEVASLVARAQAEVNVQKARIEQVQRQLQAEVIEPAIAHRDALIFAAEGHAASTVEDGRARAEALEEIANVWQTYGESAKQALLMQKLESVAALLTSTIRPIEVDRLTLIESTGNGSGHDEGGGWSRNAIRASEEIRAATGLDLGGLAKKWAGAAQTTETAPERPARKAAAKTDASTSAAEPKGASAKAVVAAEAQRLRAERSALQRAVAARASGPTETERRADAQASGRAERQDAASARWAASDGSAAATGEHGSENTPNRAARQDAASARWAASDGVATGPVSAQRPEATASADAASTPAETAAQAAPQRTVSPRNPAVAAGVRTQGWLHRRNGSPEGPVWYVEQDGRPSGPITGEQLEKLVQEGKASASTLVWRQGFADWSPIDGSPRRLSRST